MMKTLAFALFATAAAEKKRPMLGSARPLGMNEEIVGDPCKLASGSITQSTDCGVTAGTGLACQNGGVVAGDNHYYRRFLLAKDHKISTTYTVTSVQFAVEQLTLSPATPLMPITVNLYSISSSANLLIANLVKVGKSSVINADSSADNTLLSAAISGAVDGSKSDLVVEFVVPDYHYNPAQKGSFFPGANKAGQLEPSYILAGNCSINEPTDFAAIGYVVDLAMVVNGGAKGVDYKLD